MKDAHSFSPNAKVCHWQYCTKCGLVALRNEATQTALRLGCNWYQILYGKNNVRRPS